MKYQAVIFDLDGVICFTDEYHYLAWKQMADSLGVYFDREINNRLRGVSRMESLEIVLERYEGPALSAERKAELAAMKNDIYRESLAQMSPADLSDEVRSTLDGLRGMGLKLAIGSSSKNTPFILGQLGLGGYFDAVSDGNNITRSKPDPEVFLKAAEMLGLEPSVCLCGGGRRLRRPGRPRRRFRRRLRGRRRQGPRRGVQHGQHKRAARYSRQIRSGIGKGPSSKTEICAGARKIGRHRERQERFSRCPLSCQGFTCTAARQPMTGRKMTDYRKSLTSSRLCV